MGSESNYLQAGEATKTEIMTEDTTNVGSIRQPQRSPTQEGTRLQEGTSNIEDEVVDLYRGVSPSEFDDVFRMRGFRPKLAGDSMDVKQFGLNLDEVIRLGDFFLDTAAVIRARIPRSTLNQLDFTPVDRTILKSGSVDFIRNKKTIGCLDRWHIAVSL
jgi:hypothetical protein